MVLWLLVGCNGQPQDRIVVAGSSTVQPIVEVAAQAFEAAHPTVRIDIQGGGSSVGISSVGSGLSDIGTISRPLKADEDLVATQIAIDGIAIVVHADNPISGLTRAQLVDLYAGAVRQWDAVGGNSHPVTLVNKEEGRATLELFEDYTGLKGRFRADAIIIGPNGQAITTVAGNPDAIAYVSIGAAVAAEAQGAAIRRVTLDGVAPTPEQVLAGAYPLSRPLNVVTKGPPEGLAKDFIAFLLSAEGRAIVVSQDFVAPPAGS